MFFCRRRIGILSVMSSPYFARLHHVSTQIHTNTKELGTNTQQQKQQKCMALFICDDNNPVVIKRNLPLMIPSYFVGENLILFVKHNRDWSHGTEIGKKKKTILMRNSECAMQNKENVCVCFCLFDYFHDLIIQYFFVRKKTAVYGPCFIII